MIKKGFMNGYLNHWKLCLKMEQFEMTKKSIMFSTIIGLVFLLAGSLSAANKVNLKKAANLKANAKGFAAAVGLKAAIGLTDSENLVEVRSRKDLNQKTHTRYNQTFNGIRVWGHQVIVTKDSLGDIEDLRGTKIEGIAEDIPETLMGVNADTEYAMETVKEIFVDQYSASEKWTYENETSELVVYINKDGNAQLCYFVSFFAVNKKGDKPTRPYYFIDADTMEVVHTFDGLAWADGTGPGGNQKIGQYYYGTDYPAFNVTQSGSTCTMNNANVKTVNLNHGTSSTTAYSYTCPENTVKTINGAYSPLNDAHYFGGVIFDMYNDWFSVPPLTQQLVMRVHYSTNYENAFWNGSSMTFGDGYSTFYPLVSLDVSAHEVAHGFTEQNSNLTYSGESGGINESYSDMAGEAAEYYSRGSNDFLIGYDIMKSGTALRYMDDPTQDGRSVGHINDYYSGMDVHYSSGIYNRVFYNLATTAGWNTKMAFEVFTKANMDYWTAGTGFYAGAQDVVSAATDYGYDTDDVKAAFLVVGIDLNSIQYCTSRGNNSSYEWTSQVNVGSFSNSSGAAGYSDFTNLTINATKGTGYSVSLTPSFSGTIYSEYWRIWADLNQDGDFADAGELLFSGGPSTTTVTGTLTVPTSALTGTTRMRVSMKWNAAPSYCETFSYGEVEDYTLNVQ